MSRSLQIQTTSLDFVKSLFQNSSPSWFLSFSKKFWKQHTEIKFITTLRSVQVMLESELISEENEVQAQCYPILFTITIYVVLHELAIIPGRLLAYGGEQNLRKSR